MYNEDLKNRFIKEQYELESMRKRALRVFEITGRSEALFNRDLCTFNVKDYEEVIYYFAGHKGINRGDVSILNKYQRWCLENKIPGVSSDTLNIRPPESAIVEKVKHQTVASPKHLQEYLDFWFNPEDELGIDNIYRAYYWLAYGGMPFSEVLNIQSYEVDLDLMYIEHNGYECLLYDESLPSISNCVNLNEFIHEGNTVNTNRYSKSRAAGEILLRGFKLASNPQNFKIAILKKNKKKMTEKDIEEARKESVTVDSIKNVKVSDLKLTYERVKISGLFYRVFETERQGMTPNFLLNARWLYEGSPKRGNRKSNTLDKEMRYLKDLAREIEKEFNIWKSINWS